MPITPRFSLEQDDDFVRVIVSVPHVRVSKMEFVIDNCDFSFYCKPYLLKLTLPEPCLDNDKAKAVYDADKDNGTLIVHLPKAEHGKFFPNLDFITNLLSKPPTRATSSNDIHIKKSGETTTKTPEQVQLQRQNEMRPLIEVLSSTHISSEEDTQTQSSEKVDAVAPTPPPTKDEVNSDVISLEDKIRAMGLDLNNDTSDKTEAAKEPCIVVNEVTYGFNNGYSNFFKDLMSDFPELVDVPSPDTTPASERFVLQMTAEDQQFSPERYLGDFAFGQEDPIFNEAIAYEPNLHDRGLDQGTEAPTLSESPSNEELEQVDRVQFGDFTEKEKEQLMKLPRKSFLIEKGSMEEQRALCVLLDIVLAACYDMRITQGDPNVESSWTIRILSPALSWLNTSATPRDAVLGFVHRALVYPYLRRYDLAHKCVQDAYQLFSSGQRPIVRLLLIVHNVFEKSELFYLLNKLFITDLLIWIQTLEPSVIHNFSSTLHSAVLGIDKHMLRFRLSDLEAEVNGENEHEEVVESEEESETSSSEESSSSESSDDTSSESSESSTDINDDFDPDPSSESDYESSTTSSESEPSSSSSNTDDHLRRIHAPIAIKKPALNSDSDLNNSNSDLSSNAELNSNADDAVENVSHELLNEIDASVVGNVAEENTAKQQVDHVETAPKRVLIEEITSDNK